MVEEDAPPLSVSELRAKFANSNSINKNSSLTSSKPTSNQSPKLTKTPTATSSTPQSLKPTPPHPSSQSQPSHNENGNIHPAIPKPNFKQPQSFSSPSFGRSSDPIDAPQPPASALIQQLNSRSSENRITVTTNKVSKPPPPKAPKPKFEKPVASALADEVSTPPPPASTLIQQLNNSSSHQPAIRNTPSIPSKPSAAVKPILVPKVEIQQEDQTPADVQPEFVSVGSLSHLISKSDTTTGTNTSPAYRPSNYQNKISTSYIGTNSFVGTEPTTVAAAPAPPPLVKPQPRHQQSNIAALAQRFSQVINSNGEVEENIEVESVATKLRRPPPPVPTRTPSPSSEQQDPPPPSNALPSLPPRQPASSIFDEEEEEEEQLRLNAAPPLPPRAPPLLPARPPLPSRQSSNRSDLSSTPSQSRIDRGEGGPLCRPFALPQIADGAETPFLRGFSSELEDLTGLKQRDIVGFIDALNLALLPNEYLANAGRGLAAIGMVVPGVGHIVTTSLHGVTYATKLALGKENLSRYLQASNSKIFHPVGLHVQICSSSVLTNLVRSIDRTQFDQPPPTTGAAKYIEQQESLQQQFSPLYRSYIGKICPITTILPPILKDPDLLARFGTSAGNKISNFVDGNTTQSQKDLLKKGGEYKNKVESAFTAKMKWVVVVNWNNGRT